MMDIRRLEKNDIDDLVSLYGYLHEGEVRPDVNSLLAVWDKTENAGVITYWGLFFEGQLVSTCQVVTVPNFTRGCKPYCFIENVVTHPGFRNKGCGKAIIKHALSYAWSAGCYKAMLMTGSKEERVFDFYKSVGFNGNEKHAFVAKPKST
jgi:GNAT superfamily N-acetyltransferase